MTLLSRLLCLVWLLPWLLPAFAAAQEPAELSQRYLAWRQAMTISDLAGWRANTAPLRQAQLENEIISRGSRFPADLFADELAPPDLDGLSLVATRSTGVACHLFYFGRIDFGLGVDAGEIPRGVLLLRFHLHEGQWLFDSLSYYNLTGQPELEAALAAGQNEALRAPEFAPLEELPEVPARVGAPEHVAQLYVRCPLHRVQARINGVAHTYEASGDIGVETVIGGLESGSNTIRFGVEQLPGVPTPWPALPAEQREANSAPLELSLWLVPSPGRGPSEPRLVWRWTAESPEDLPEGPLEIEFEVP